MVMNLSLAALATVAAKLARAKTTATHPLSLGCSSTRQKEIWCKMLVHAGMLVRKAGVRIAQAMALTSTASWFTATLTQISVANKLRG